MTSEKFITAIEELYGKYSDAWKMLVRSYLKIFTDTERDDLFNYTTLRFSSRWNAVPDVPVLEEVRREYGKQYGFTLGCDWIQYLNGKNRIATTDRSLIENEEKPATLEEALELLGKIKSSLGA